MAIIYNGALARITLRADKYARIAFVATAATLGIGAVEAVNLAPGAAAANLGATAAQLRDRSTHTGAQAISTVSGLQASLDAKIPASEKGANNGVAPLDSSGKIASAYLPSFVDDVLEFADLAAFPVTGESGKIYVALNTSKPYRWSGSAYVEISASPGSTDVVTEGATNLYHTSARVVAVLATNTGPITAQTPGSADDSTRVATTEWVRDYSAAISAGVVSFNGRSGNVTLTRADVEGVTTNSLRASGDFSELQLGAGAYRARLIRAANEDAAGEVVLQLTVDNFQESFIDALSVETSGVARFAYGLKYNKAVFLGVGADLNADIPAGFYDVIDPVNGPWSVLWCYLEVQRHSFGPTEYCKQVLTHLGVGAGQDRTIVWHRVRRGSFGWGPWEPVSGFVTPAHLGGACASSMAGATTDETAALARWIDYGLANPRVPLVLDGFYKMTSNIDRSIAGLSGFGIRGLGPGARCGLYQAGSSRLYVTGADHDNPSGFNADQYQFSDFQIGIDSDRSEPCILMVAAPDTGSAAPGLSMRNVHQRRASDGAGVTGAVFYMVGIRNFDIQDVSGQGKYFQYQGNLFWLVDTAGGAPVEGCFTNVRMDHCGDMFRLAGSTGDVAYDDWQGMHFDRCTGLAVNKLIYMTTGPESPGFSEWVTISRCHAYYREAAVLSEKVGNLKVNDCYFLGHGNQPVIQGIGKTGSSIVDPVTITNNVFKFDATGATRLGINLPAGQKGKQWGNGFQNATSNNFGDTENSSSTYVF